MLFLKWKQWAETIAHHTGSPLLLLQVRSGPRWTRAWQVDTKMPKTGNVLLIQRPLWITETHASISEYDSKEEQE